MSGDITTVPLPEVMRGLAKTVDEALDRWMPTEQHSPSRLAAALRYAVFPGGKRIRPVLALMACEACGGASDDALPAACAVELVHCYSLVHDDLPAMDNDDLRRGRPTCHKAFGEALGILAGDGLLTLAFEILACHSATPQLAARSCAELARAAGVAGMVGGQADDLERTPADASVPNRLAILRSIHERKTGALLRASVRLGAIAANATAEQWDALDDYGQKIGLIFQITDDLLDSEGEEAKVGKRVGKDRTRGKLTYPSLLGRERSLEAAHALAAEARGSLERLGTHGDQLRELTRLVVERDR